MLRLEQIRKSASMHSHNSSKCNSRLLQFTNQPVTNTQIARYRNSISGRSSFGLGNALCLSPPPIPDPDYSQSDEECEQAKISYKTSTLPLPGNRKNSTKMTLRSIDNGSVRHFNIDEIRKARSQLRSSSSFSTNQVIPNATEDGDNSSSGVSSDQEIPVLEQPTNSTCIPSATKQLPSFNSDTNGVSESKESELVVLPPLEFVGNVSPAAVEVLEPPPQFCDSSFN